MRASGEHIKAVRAAIADRLVVAGFSQRRKAILIFTKPLTPEVSAWVGLNTRTQKTADGEVGVRPTMGVRHQPLMRVYEQASRSKDLDSMPTIKRGLADLLGNAALEWLFPAGEDPGPIAGNLVATVERVGLAWSVAHTAPAAMRDAVLNLRAFGVSYSNEQVLPLLDLFCGGAAASLAQGPRQSHRRGSR